MAEELKKQKQIAFLAPFVDRAETLLKHGLRSIRYWRCEDISKQYETELQRNSKILFDAPNLNLQTKEEKEKASKDVKEAIASIDDIAYHMFYLYADALATPEQRLVNPEFKDDVDWAQMDYVNRVAKSVNNRHMHAPGFDSVGGAPRGGSTS